MAFLEASIFSFNEKSFVLSPYKGGRHLILNIFANKIFDLSMDNNFNPDKQHTLLSPVSISGTGLHTGINVDMTLKPANVGFGFQFQRIDLPGMPVIKADCDLVTDT